MKKTFLKKIIPFLAFFFSSSSSFALAASGDVLPATCPGGTDTVGHLLNFFTCIISQSVIPLLITLAIVFFIWGVGQYMLNANDSTKREEGRKFMIWGIISLFVIVSIWGLIKLLTGTFGINFVIPQLQQ